VPRPNFTLSKREITHLIFLSGQKPTGYRVHTARLDGLDDIDVPRAVTGHALVHALREIAYLHPELLPASRPIPVPRKKAEKRHDR
jgi:hypothetical protein